MKEASEGKVNALVTGGNGTLGREIVQCLLEDGGYNVHSLDLLLPEDTNRNTDICQYIQTDITNCDDLLVAFKGIDVVFHVAGIVPQLSSTDELMYKVNVLGTDNVIKACKECSVKRLIYTSTIGVLLSKNPKQIVDQVDENYPLPESPFNAYSITKGAAEKAVRKANGTGGVLTCALRPGTVVSPPYLKETLSNPAIIGDGSSKYSYVPLKPCAEAHLLAEKKLHREGKESVAAGSVYNLCIEDVFPQRECTEFMASEVGKKVEFISFPMVKLAAYVNTIVYKLTGLILVSPFLTTEVVEFLKRSYSCSSARAHQELEWPALPPWKEIFGKAIKEYAEESKKEK